MPLANFHETVVAECYGPIHRVTDMVVNEDQPFIRFDVVSGLGKI